MVIAGIVNLLSPLSSQYSLLSTFLEVDPNLHSWGSVPFAVLLFYIVLVCYQLSSWYIRVWRGVFRGSAEFQRCPSLPTLCSSRLVSPWEPGSIALANIIGHFFLRLGSVSWEGQNGQPGNSLSFPFDGTIVVIPSENTLPLGMETSKPTEHRVERMGSTNFC